MNGAIAPRFFLRQTISMDPLKSLLRILNQLFEHPLKVGIIALALAFGGLVAQGTLVDLWNLKSERWRLQESYLETLKANRVLQFKIQQARNSDKFIGRQAREKLDLIKDDELVFIFENEDIPKTPSAKR